jgi:hypothetical protein
MRRQECVIRVVGISGIVADDTVAVILASEVWTVPKPTSWKTCTVYTGCTFPIPNIPVKLSFRKWGKIPNAVAVKQAENLADNFRRPRNPFRRLC